MKLYERLENNNFDEIDRNRAIELIEGGNGHLVYNENYFKLQKENEIYKKNSEIMSKENLSTAEQLKVEIKENFRLKNQLENNRKEYQETYKDVREELKELKKENEELKRINKIVENITEEDIEKAIKEDDECEDEVKTKLSLRQFDINVVYTDYLEKLNEYKENNIPVQKVKDKIEELKKDETNKYYDMFLEERDLENTIKVLQELLDGSDTNVGSIENEE